MQVDFNPYSASQIKNKERMIRQLEDDDNNDDGSNVNVDVNGKKKMLPSKNVLKRNNWLQVLENKKKLQ